MSAPELISDLNQIMEGVNAETDLTLIAVHKGKVHNVIQQDAEWLDMLAVADALVEYVMDMELGALERGV
jgi:uncharacterized protein YejL (UPF0352 family)